MSKPFQVEDPKALQDFEQFECAVGGASCVISGERIEIGDPIFARNEDEARNGAGICQAVYVKLTQLEDSTTLPEKDSAGRLYEDVKPTQLEDSATLDDGDPQGNDDPDDLGRKPKGKK